MTDKQPLPETPERIINDSIVFANKSTRFDSTWQALAHGYKRGAMTEYSALKSRLSAAGEQIESLKQERDEYRNELILLRDIFKTNEMKGSAERVISILDKYPQL